MQTDSDTQRHTYRKTAISRDVISALSLFSDFIKLVERTTINIGP